MDPASQPAQPVRGRAALGGRPHAARGHDEGADLLRRDPPPAEQARERPLEVGDAARGPPGGALLSRAASGEHAYPGAAAVHRDCPRAGAIR
ncbi:MAG: hypothetical protein A2X50_15620 [Candidatus Rokubacteria bacterium GWF2_70_14]|nr:MAG: hypothetical protein A2X50_15620 [Candidatus Rokubacteria bacterium GWF2_70_14]